MEDDDGIKVVLIGESEVGKTCIINQFINREFDENYKAIIHTQLFTTNIELPIDKRIKLFLWDTAGQKKCRSLARIFCKKAKVVILVYDITRKDSFNELKNYWYNQIKENAPKDVIIAIAANKSDLYEERQVEDDDGEEFAKSIGAFFEPTSAKNDSGITNLFENIVKKLLEPDFNFSPIGLKY